MSGLTQTMHPTYVHPGRGLDWIAARAYKALFLRLKEAHYCMLGALAAAAAAARVK